MEKFEKVWKSVEKFKKCGKVWKSLKSVEKFEKVWKSLKKCGKVWKSLKKFEKVWKSLKIVEKFEKWWKSLKKCGKVWKSVENPYIFPSFSCFIFFSNEHGKLSLKTNVETKEQQNPIISHFSATHTYNLMYTFIHEVF